MKTTRLPQISVSNRQRKVAVDRAKLEVFAWRVLPLCAAQAGHGLTSLEEINVVLVSDRKISQLHRRFMQIGGPTDVLTFQHGEILISVETAQRQARSYRTSLGQELRLYLVHGLLHLHGFDDRTSAGRARMMRLQERVIARAEDSAASRSKANKSAGARRWIAASACPPRKKWVKAKYKTKRVRL